MFRGIPCEGKYFSATDKLGRKYNYRVKEVRKNDNRTEYIIWNLDTLSESEVEAEWFNQREITERSY